MKSALYEGTVRHRRFAPVEHAFRYRIFYAYLDLAEVPDVLDGIPGWSGRGPALARFDRRDHLGDARLPLDQAVRDLVEQRCGTRPAGRISLLAMPRTLGVGFNPISVYYCYREDGSIGHVVAEVDNTPWGERHCYVVDAERDNVGTGSVLRFIVPKAFHVSPFHPMSQEYAWRFNVPGRSLVVHMENSEHGEVLTDATLVLRRRALDKHHAGRVLLRHPAMAATVVAGIYAQAARLWLKGTPYHPHPSRLAAEAEGASP
ncbi:MAG: DUF1365 domain-containing protein [Myxococcota bacterium]